MNNWSKKQERKKFVDQEDVLAFAQPGTDLYYEIERELLNNDVDITLDDEVEDETEILSAVFADDDLEEDEDDVEDEEEPDDLSLSGLEVEEEELINIETIASNIKIDDPVRMYLKEIGQIPITHSRRRT